MENRRLQRIERLIQKEVEELFRLQAQRLGQSIIISVTRVRISSDLSTAKVFLSVYPSDRTEEIMQNVNQSKNTLRYDLGLRIGRQIRHIPELSFFVDDTLDYIENINRLLNPGQKV